MTDRSLAHYQRESSQQSTQARPCRSCHGSGEVLEDVEVAHEWYETVVHICPTCKGSGVVTSSLYGPGHA